MLKAAIMTAAAAALFASGIAFAGHHHHYYDGAPSGFAEDLTFTSIDEMLDKTYDHQMVVLEGRLTEYLGKARYVFTDAQGETITVKLDDDRNWSHIGKDQPIVIYGKLSKSLARDIIYVKDARAQAE